MSPWFFDAPRSHLENLLGTKWPSGISQILPTKTTIAYQIRHMATEKPTNAHTVQVLLCSPGAFPELRDIPPTLEGMEKLVGGPLTTFETSAFFEVIAVGNANLNRRGLYVSYQRKTRRRRCQGDLSIEGPFFLVGVNPAYRTFRGYLRPLRAAELDEALRDLGPKLPRSHWRALMEQVEDGTDWLEVWGA